MVEQNNIQYVEHVRRLEQMIWPVGARIEDIYALNLLQPLINGYPVLPFTKFALRPLSLIYIINTILICNRKSVLEFGSGLSTIIIGRLFKKNGIPGTVTSVEHHQAWKERLGEILHNEELDDIVKVIYAPLTNSRYRAGSSWYNSEVLDEQLPSVKFDTLIVDGPPAWEKNKEFARYPALPYVYNKLCQSYSVFLDDVNRPGEQFVIEQWKKEFGLSFAVAGGSLACSNGPDAFLADPF